jgi:site-specific DNA recombinase
MLLREREEATMTRRAGLYVRLSVAKTTTQATDDATDRQEERARAYCTAKGWQVARVYADVDVGAYRAPGAKAPPRRDDFEQALADVEAGTIDALVFFKLDRFVRDHGDFERALAICERHGAVLASVLEPIDTSHPYGEASARTMVTYARLESQTIGLRVAAQREQAARKGLPSPGGWKCFGYEGAIRDEQGRIVNRDRVGMVIVPSEAAIITEAANRVLAGEALNSIARDFTRRGLRAAGGSGAFYTRRLKRILLTPRVAGLRAYNGEVVREAAWPAILPRPTWEAVRAILEAPERRRGGKPARWPLAGLLWCTCGQPLRTRGSRYGTVYACDPTKLNFQGCGRIQINARHAEAIVLEMVGTRDWRRLAGALRSAASASTADPHLAEQLAADEVELVVLARQRALRKLSEPEWLAMREALAERIAAAKAILEQRAALPPEALDPSVPLARSWPKWTVAQQRAVLKQIFARITIGPATRMGRELDPDRVTPQWRI